MEYTFGNVKMMDSETLVRTSSNDTLRTDTQPLDEILSPRYSSTPRTPQERQIAARDGGLVPGILHIIAGPQQQLSKVLMRLAIMAQLPRVDGGVGASRVFYAELNNFFDPYQVSQIAMEKSLTPAKVLDKIEIARGFNWDQAIEIIAKLLPAKACCPGSVVLISGLTSFMDPADPAHFDGLREMIGGLKACQQNAAPVYMVATVPIASGSMFKPRGGHLLYHFAGCLLAVSEPRETKAGSRVTDWVLVRHPAYGERTLQCWVHAPVAKTVKKARSRKGDLSTFRTLEDFAASPGNGTAKHARGA
nr:hypothetical protein [Candidatus Sigynarchaeota archaeon]